MDQTFLPPVQLQTCGWAADRAGLTINRLYALVREGLLPAGVVVRFGRTIRVHPARFEEWIAQGGAAFAGGSRREPRDVAVA